MKGESEDQYIAKKKNNVFFISYNRVVVLRAIYWVHNTYYW